jgi:hypothetical protein
MDAAERIDKILHRNRSILLEIMGKTGTEKLVTKAILDSKKFNFDYVTHVFNTSNNERLFYIYDFCWMITPNQEIQILKVGNKMQSLETAA